MEAAAAAGEVRRLQGGRGADSGEGRERGSGEEGERRHRQGGAPAAARSGSLPVERVGGKGRGNGEGERCGEGEGKNRPLEAEVTVDHKLSIAILRCSGMIPPYGRLVLQGM